jgi:SAM-dependent methyltransferase
MTGQGMGEDGGRAEPPTPRDVLGVPALPPGAVTVRLNRLRAAIGRLHTAMGPPPVQILEGMFGLLEHRVLTALCEAGVPDALTKPTTVDALADDVGADPVMLERLLRFGATRGWVRIDRRGRVRPTAVTKFLRRGHPGGWRSWVEFAGGAEVVAAVGALSAMPVADPFAAVHGRAFFTWMAEHPERWAIFDEAMAAGARMHALGLAAALDWKRTRRVCDVGGGTGVLLAALLDLHPHLEGTVLDLPGVVGRAVDHPRLTVVGGDAFLEIPAGFDTYLFVNVLHDWDDERATRLLARAAGAIGVRAGARIVVVDNDRPTVPVADVAVATDVLMAALTPGGRERDAAAFAAVGRAAGLRLERSVRLPSADFAHVFVPSSDG